MAVVTVSFSTLHAVRNVWDADGRHYVVSGNQDLYRSDDGGTNYTKVYTFPDTPGRIYGLFVDSAKRVWVSTSWEATGIDGRCYKSTDHGATFTQVTAFDAAYNSGNVAFWPMVEDTNGDLYLGQYNLTKGGTNTIQKCNIWKSTDGGTSWTNIADATWSATYHVHGLGIDPSSGWLYATIGDVDGTDGIWRSKLKNGSDWVRKTTATNLQYIPIVFKDGYIYTADDAKLGQVSRFQDDGTSSGITPTVVLNTQSGHNNYYLAKDNSGRLWTCFANTSDVDTPGVAGGVWVSDDGLVWNKLIVAPNIAYAEWYNPSDIPASKWTMNTGTTQFGPTDRCQFPWTNFNSIVIEIE